MIAGHSRRKDGRALNGQSTPWLSGMPAALRCARRPSPRCCGCSVKCPIRLLWLNALSPDGGLEALLCCFISCLLSSGAVWPASLLSLSRCLFLLLSCFLCHGGWLYSSGTVSQLDPFSFRLPFLECFNPFNERAMAALISYQHRMVRKTCFSFL